MIRAVVFDLGEVLASPPSLLPELADHLDTTVEQLAAHYWTGRRGYDAGEPADGYWGPLVEAVGGTGDADLFAELALLDASIWSELRPTARRLLRDCRAAGVTVAILSNSPHAMQTVADRAPWRRDIDHLFISATLGVVKPDPAIHALVADELGLPGSALAFIDDKQENVAAALAAGWHAHLWVDDADTRAWLESQDVL